MGNIVTSIIVKCDKCNWKQSAENIMVWHNRLCPKCGESIIVTNNDVKIFSRARDYIDLLVSRGHTIVPSLSKKDFKRKTQNLPKGEIVDLRIDSRHNDSWKLGRF